MGTGTGTGTYILWQTKRRGMPGIAGIVFPDAFQADNSLWHIMDTLKHRGESYKVHAYKHFHVSQCHGSVPTYKHLVIGLDGILYNKKKLIAKLQEQCRIDPSSTDVELMAEAYLCWGNEFIKNIDGDFAFFILDQKKEKLLLGRDRIGKKPLYWYSSPRYFIFSSELKGLLGSGVVPQTIDMDAFACYLYFGFIPQDLSPIQGANKLLPGHMLLLNANRNFNISPYWSYSSQFQNIIIEDQTTIIETVDSILRKSVAERSANAETIACAISGGLGSASIAYYLKEVAASKQLHAYTVGFQHENAQEFLASQEVVQTLDLTYTKEVVTPRTFFEDFIKIIWHLDEPVADLNIISIWKLAVLAKSKKVLFSGMGSDETLAGHNRYTQLEQPVVSRFNRLMKLMMPSMMKLILPLLNVVSRNQAFKLLKNPYNLFELTNYLNQNALFSQKILEKASPRLAKLFDPYSFLHRFPNLSMFQSELSSFLYFDVKTRLVDNYILQYERLTSAQGLDWRTPYLSLDLIEYLAGVADPYKISSNETFFILKKILKDVFPSTMLNRPKMTRKEFLKPWIESTGLQRIFQKLPRGTLVEQGFISEAWLRKQVATAEQSKAAFQQLWGILILEIWCRLYINRPIKEPPDMNIFEFMDIIE